MRTTPPRVTVAMEKTTHTYLERKSQKCHLSHWLSEAVGFTLDSLPVLGDTSMPHVALQIRVACPRSTPVTPTPSHGLLAHAEPLGSGRDRRSDCLNARLRNGLPRSTRKYVVYARPTHAIPLGQPSPGCPGHRGLAADLPYLSGGELRVRMQFPEELEVSSLCCFFHDYLLLRDNLIARLIWLATSRWMMRGSVSLVTASGRRSL